MKSKKISDIFKQKKKTFSFEFFPPKNYQSTLELGINIGQLITLDPSFVSVTYGAGGSTQNLSFDLIDYIQNKIGLPSMAHYTCINATKDRIINDLNDLKLKGVFNLMLLRGDLPSGQENALNDDFQHASDLISLAKSFGIFDIGAAGYPELHPESSNLDNDIKWLKHKVDTGADFIITQMFFNNNLYFDFVRKAREAGINNRIIPGIMPITNFKQIKKFSDMCGASIPEETISKLTPIQESKEKMYNTGIEIARDQCVDLLREVLQVYIFIPLTNHVRPWIYSLLYLMD